MELEEVFDEAANLLHIKSHGPCSSELQSGHCQLGVRGSEWAELWED